jgi:hypothetical protein
MKFTLPVQLNPISRRKDRSVKLSFETRELTPSELISLMSFEGAEMWLLLASVEAEIAPESVPNTKPELGIKSRTERLRDILFVWFKQSVADQTFVGDFETFLNLKLDSIIDGVKTKLHD